MIALAGSLRCMMWLRAFFARSAGNVHTVGAVWISSSDHRIAATSPECWNVNISSRTKAARTGLSASQASQTVRQFVGGQHAVAWAFPTGTLDAKERIRSNFLAPDRPAIGRSGVGKRAVRGDDALLRLDGVERLYSLPVGDAARWAIPPVGQIASEAVDRLRDVAFPPVGSPSFSPCLNQRAKVKSASATAARIAGGSFPRGVRVFAASYRTEEAPGLSSRDSIGKTPSSTFASPASRRIAKQQRSMTVQPQGADFATS